MPTVAGKRRKVRFPLAHLKTAPLATQHQQQQQRHKPKRPGKPSTGESLSGKMASPARRIPALFTQPPPIRDPLVTETIDLQDATMNKCLPFLKGVADSQPGPFNACGVPALQRDDHIAYLYDSLEDYPAGFVAMDASRPWMVYWALAGLTLLGESVSRVNQRVMTSLRPMQNRTGGFGGGHGQTSHLASSYAAILSLAMVGTPDAFALVDRQAMWRWLGRLKQADGGFRVCEGGEEDVRGAYCATVIISLLDLPLALPPDSAAREAGFENLTDGLAEYLSRCQSFEGGISGSPGVEAHGAYAFCALACLAILGPPEQTIARHMNLPLLLSWLSARQYAPEGGFSGRTNKLVDGCYSHWVGGCWPLLQSALDGKPQADKPPTTVGSLFSREGLARYILSCCQHPVGGLRDKPGKHADSYHTCYVLTGLSATQHVHYRTDSSPCSHKNFAAAFSWQFTPTNPEEDVFEKYDRLTAFHPLFVVPHDAARKMRLWFEGEPFANDQGEFDPGFAP
ncbi:hypothetical protein N7532_008931 [Penicillium argentinense]|uniref:Protein farnesyltransferase subunit beta n=1 Tax=Penicillium argentinense TaxID=1131581 RepID=A0A9W9EYE3_9EURO|nr:uncharacterized protein N7532_008931 [Penicillium argentinense]KAJ5090247.1 hypothetical protein N7532_008931 [Penicillium argentinense]